ncbi:membrane metallo-endopeptidase-like 1 [Acanthaster planci]|uniref:Membrane metallo-endopeptidase-like 1 n=1 Tax=Acanthaster planci TaxID=133434 RepID=A0A8B7YW95_ACAPL|nr:membrane metallo-endopeptidase-like 1 [Acanthaster planci]XP_022096958.1 membrane metallo-endopeptidase-like 1 [Acanthaster planci]
MGRRGSREELVFEDNIGVRRPSKLFLFILFLLFLIILGLTGALVYFILDSKDCRSKAALDGDMCTSKQCIKSAAVYLDSMDNTTSPCENFYQYACGGWVKKHVIPEDRSRYSSFSALDEDVTVKCKELMEEDAVLGEPLAITNVRKYYKSCLDLDTINSLDAKPLTDNLEAVGGWPVLGTNPGGNWSEDNYEFEDLSAMLYREYGINVVVAAWVGVDDKNSSLHVLAIDQPSLLMGGREYYLESNYSKERQAYTDYMVNVAVALGAEEDVAKIDAADVLAFETTIAEFSVPPSERRDAEKLYNPIQLGDLVTSYPEVNWTSYFNQLLPAKLTPLPDTERVINYSPPYMRNATDWLKSQTKRVVANYMVWWLVASKVGSLGDKFLDIQQEFSSVLSGTSARSARWKRCIGEVQASVMELAMGRMYVDQYFPEEARQKTAEMVGNLKTAFKAMLTTNDWLAEDDKKVAAEKADAMKVNVGYPEWIKDNAKLDKHYVTLENFTQDGYCENGVKYTRWILQKSLGSLRDPVDKETWDMGPAEVNAYYSPNENKIVFPAGILQPPFYHKDLPWYSNYGGIGVVIGHEITHGFDDEGRQFDKDGNLKAWWSKTSIDKFKQRAQCIVDQYSAFVMPENGQHLNGIQTQGENIADNGGLKESLKAYRDNVKSQQRLPGIDLNADQMFFLSYGQVWCSLYRPQAVASLILTNPHSPGRYRVIGPTQNSEAFASAFNCKSGSYMNPEKKCEIW